MSPITIQIQEHKEMIDKRANNLKKVAEQQGSLDERINDLEDMKNDLLDQQKTTRFIRTKINQHVFLDQELETS